MRKILALLGTFFLLSLPIQADTLELDENTITIRGGIDSRSMDDATKQLFELSAKLEPTDTITLALDSPGGSVVAGLNFIQAMKSVPQNIRAVCFFCASMSFTIYQNADVRYSTPYSVLMAHRASGGFRGQFSKGEVESRLKLWTSVIKQIEAKIAKRLGLSAKEFEDKVKDEYWVYGLDATKEKVSDTILDVRCSESLINSYQYYYVRSFMGMARYKFSRCPLIKAPIKEYKNAKRKSKR